MRKLPSKILIKVSARPAILRRQSIDKKILVSLLALSILLPSISFGQYNGGGIFWQILLGIGGAPQKKKQAPPQSSKKHIVVDYTATWCGPCKEITPLVEACKSNSNCQVFIADIDQLGKEGKATFEDYKKRYDNPRGSIPFVIIDGKAYVGASEELKTALRQIANDSGRLTTVPTQPPAQPAQKPVVVFWPSKNDSQRTQKLEKLKNAGLIELRLYGLVNCKINKDFYNCTDVKGKNNIKIPIDVYKKLKNDKTMGWYDVDGKLDNGFVELFKKYAEFLGEELPQPPATPPVSPPTDLRPLPPLTQEALRTNFIIECMGDPENYSGCDSVTFGRDKSGVIRVMSGKICSIGGGQCVSLDGMTLDELERVLRDFTKEIESAPPTGEMTIEVYCPPNISQAKCSNMIIYLVRQGLNPIVIEDPAVGDDTETGSFIIYVGNRKVAEGSGFTLLQTGPLTRDAYSMTNEILKKVKELKDRTPPERSVTPSVKDPEAEKVNVEFERYKEEVRKKFGDDAVNKVLRDVGL